jgi:hypothetical protein
LKDLETLFIIKTRLLEVKSGQFTDVYSKEEFKAYPTDEQILNEMTRWNFSISHHTVYSQVEKLYKLRQVKK